MKNRIIKSLNKFKSKRPTQVILETTNHCNLNCPFCMVGMQNELLSKNGNTAHSLMSRPMGIMSQNTFNIVIERLIKFRIKKVYLHFQGEPFLNKLTPSFAKTLKNKGFEVGVFTNGQAFTDKSITDLAGAEIDLVRFSVDGASEETYQKNRVGGTFAKVLENMKKVVEAHKGKKTRIEWQFLPMKNNEHEVEKARTIANDININFFTKGFRETDPKLVPLNKDYRSKFMQKPCSDIYRQLGIYWNGDVVPCCYDVDGKEIMGNILDSSLRKIWKNKKYKLFRLKIDNFHNNPNGEPEICKSCLRWR